MRFRLKTWSVSHARLMRRFYILFEQLIFSLFPLWRLIGFKRIGPLITSVEKNIKKFLFDCQMCGHCVLDKTGMSCPMNCPKQLQNGPCGGVRIDSMCEVDGSMRCVWVEAWRGLSLLGTTADSDHINPPVDHLLQGRSSWLSIAFHQELPRPQK